MKISAIIAFILVMVGALVWFMIGVFDFNLVSAIFGGGSNAVVSRIIYSLVGVSALWLIFYCLAYRPFRSMN
ncbi:MAG: DUF378 domain-containing protein [Clostridia bacterium]|nr:DUF378 domain-containing protein [Clostridia bacterium]